MQGLSQSTAYVLLLGASTSSLPPPLLESLAKFMPQLKYLRMMTTYNLLDVFDPVRLLIISLKFPSLHPTSRRLFAKTLQRLWRHSLAFIPLSFLECIGAHHAKALTVREGCGSRNRLAAQPLLWMLAPLTSISHTDQQVHCTRRLSSSVFISLPPSQYIAPVTLLRNFKSRATLTMVAHRAIPNLPNRRDVCESTISRLLLVAIATQHEGFQIFRHELRAKSKKSYDLDTRG